MIRIVAEESTVKAKAIIKAAKDRLEDCVNLTKSGEGTKLLDSINTTMEALATDFSAETARDFANAMDSFGVNLQKAARWAGGKWGVSGGKYENALIPREVFNTWVYKGKKVDFIANELKSFWDANSELREAIKGPTANGYSYSLKSIPQDPLLKNFFIEGIGVNKSNYGKYECALAFICSEFNNETGLPLGKNSLAYLTTQQLDVMWGGKGCEVKNNNSNNSGFNLKGTMTTKGADIKSCTYFTKYPGSSVAIFDERSGKVCVCKSVEDLDNVIVSTEKGGTGSREGMWRLRDDWMNPTKEEANQDDPEEKYKESPYTEESYEVLE